jgi:3-hexulose-6-phosphate synthase
MKGKKDMKLQISFDNHSLQKSLEIAKQIAAYADIIEIGTVPLYRYGKEIVQEFKKVCGDVSLLVDTKISDRGSKVVPIFAEVDAQWLTVMAGTSNTVIHATCTKAHQMGMHVMMDLLDAPALGQSAMDAKNLGVDALLLHESYEDTDPLIFLDKWDLVKGNTSLPIFISAKITRDNVMQIIELKPDGLVIGESIIDADDPAKEAKFFAQLCKEN